MASDESSAVAAFKQKSAMILSRVVEVKNMAEAMMYALDVCTRKECCELIFAGREEERSDGSPALCRRATVKTIAAPALDAHSFTELEKCASARGVAVIRSGMREHLSGIDVGFSVVDLGIAESGSCVLAANSEDERIASMVCEIHVIALSKSRIVDTLYDAEACLQRLMEQGCMYVSFISGPSRTADIERVLTLGVHGPLELHVALMED